MGSIIHINVLKSQSYWFHPAFPRLFMASYKSQGPRFEDLVWKLPHQPGTGLLHSSGQAACHLSTCSKIRAPVERGGSLTVSTLPVHAWVTCGQSFGATKKAHESTCIQASSGKPNSFVCASDGTFGDLAMRSSQGTSCHQQQAHLGS